MTTREQIRAAISGVLDEWGLDCPDEAAEDVKDKLTAAVCECLIAGGIRLGASRPAHRMLLCSSDKYPIVDTARPDRVT